MTLATLSETRLRFNRWLCGEESGNAGTQPDLFGGESKPAPERVLIGALRGEAYALSCFRDPTRWSFLENVCRRLETEGGAFFSNPADADTVEWGKRLKAIRRDVHKAHAFVRFKEIELEGRKLMAAWHRPQHDTLDLFVRLFCRRFPKMDWAIHTPDEAAHFEAEKLRFAPGTGGAVGETPDAWEEYWRTYYASIYNPARLMVKAMKKEMPVWHWQTLPESRLIPSLIRESQPRLAAMAGRAQTSAEPFLPVRRDSLEAVAQALDGCRGCTLHAHCKATPGRGSAHAGLVLVGEQPGDEEEKQGEPFVGPAGTLLRELAATAGMDWKQLYVTNAVKHFKHQYEGGFRLHKRPDNAEVSACRPWLRVELEMVQPRIVLCLGSTAALSVTGRLWPVERYRGTWLPSSGQYKVLLTYHPAALLRAPEEKKASYRSDLLADLRKAHEENRAAA